MKCEMGKTGGVVPKPSPKVVPKPSPRQAEPLWGRGAGEAGGVRSSFAGEEINL